MCYNGKTQNKTKGKYMAKYFAIIPFCRVGNKKVGPYETIPEMQCLVFRELRGRGLFMGDIVVYHYETRIGRLEVEGVTLKFLPRCD